MIRNKLGGVAVAMMLCLGGPALATTLKLGYSDVENFPYQMGNGERPAAPPGLAVDLIDLAAQDIGIKVEFIRMPARRLLQDMGAGLIDGAFIFSFKDDRLAFGHYPMRGDKPDSSRRITTINYVLYQRADAKLAWDGSKLSGSSMPVGINYTFSVGDDLKKLGIAIDDTAKSTTQNMTKLLTGRIDAYATLEDSGDSYLARRQETRVVKMNPPITSRDYYLMFGKSFMTKHPQQAEQLWQRLGQLRDKQTPLLLNKYVEPGGAP
ncbi:transporter substrate-binding domain-containing protein [Chitinimonas viridis]|uniref:Transporter substrate-binding domain-containing protein n=1 Tax=Chitinimonas viridis TaxID=664880 RepID=A0ABT8BC11_9NEIS|nr:transporter substrate-binding domain-containing protein [Chitinimonas viridis]MDN3578984.1 transporter substrate-binding domain-containing protein [Chitinimonas viridis]